MRDLSWSMMWRSTSPKADIDVPPIFSTVTLSFPEFCMT
jgi:hypothetical protein